MREFSQKPEYERCPVCGDDDCSGPDNHTLIRQIQPSDYSLGGERGFYANVLSTIVEVTDLTGERDARGRFLAHNWHEGEFANETVEELQNVLPEKYAVWTDSDYWSLWAV